MARIIAMRCISGSGKAHLRTTDPRLKDLPYLDIADIYTEEPEGISNRQVFTLMLDQLDSMIENDLEVVVLEAYFRRHPYQREWLEFVAGQLESQVEYIELEETLVVCIELGKEQYGEANGNGNSKPYKRGEVL